MSTVPTDVRYLDLDACLDKFTNLVDKLEGRDGPNIIWMKEQEDDTRIRELTRTWSDGIPTLNQTFADLTSGLAVVAGRANAGKSSWLINVQKGVIENNDDVIVVDLSFDDPPRKRLQQYVACNSGLRYTKISSPGSLKPFEKELRDNAIETFFSWVRNRRLIPYEAMEKLNDGRQLRLRDYRTILYLMKFLRSEYPKSKIVFFADAWNDIDITGAKGGSELAMSNYALSELKTTAQDNEVILLMNAHIRKTSEKRFGIQDIKGTSDMEYAVVHAIIVRNESREGILAEPLEYEYNNYTFPILVAEVVKNKVSEWDRPMFYPMNASACQLLTLHPTEYKEIYEIWKGKRK
jgi:hypothetical protein